MPCAVFLTALEMSFGSSPVCAARVLYTVVHEKLRPAAPEGCPAEYRAIMEACWHEDPSNR